MKSKEFSIIIPTHNRPEMLIAAVQSAIAECRDGGEVIVVDDRCERPAREVVEHLANPCLRVVENPGPHGAAGARNHGAACSRGSILFFLDDDDRILAGYLERIMDRLCNGCSADYGFAAMKAILPDGSVRVTSPRLSTGIVPQQAALRRKIAPSGLGFWVRRDTFLELGGFDSAQTVDEDTDLCVRLIASGHTAWFEQEPGTIVRQAHGGSDGNQAQLTQVTPPSVTAACYRRSYEKSAAQFPDFSEARWWMATRYIRRAAKAGDTETARLFALSQGPSPFRLALLGYWAFRAVRAGIRRHRTS
jgi:glycosyltransferase involved in cell wall biosynthesis